MRVYTEGKATRCLRIVEKLFLYQFNLNSFGILHGTHALHSQSVGTSVVSSSPGTPTKSGIVVVSVITVVVSSS